MGTILLSKNQVAERTSLCPTSIYYMTTAGKFPKPVKLGKLRRFGWIESEVEEWIQDQIKASRGLEAVS